MRLMLAAPLTGWAMPLADVPDAVFASGMLGPGVAIDPTGDTLHAPAAATVRSIHAARHAVTLALADGPELLLHVGLDTVALEGVPFDLLVGEGDAVAAGAPLLRFDLDRIVRDATAAITPVVLTSPGWTIAAARTGQLVAAGEPLFELVPHAGAAPMAPASGASADRTVTVRLPHGLHARPAARITAVVRDSGVAATLTADGRSADAASATALLTLGLPHGASVAIEARGRNAAAVVDAIADLLTHERDAAPPEAPLLPPGDAAVPDGAIGGVPAAPGLAIGTARWLRPSRPETPKRGEGPEAERARLAEGIATVDAALRDGHDLAANVMAAHRAILADPALRDAADSAIAGGAHAATAFLAAADAQAAQLRASADRRLAERGDDIEDIGQRVARAILGIASETIVLAPDTVVLARDLLPSALLALTGASPAAIVLANGGPTAHVAILAAGMGVPMLVAAGPGLHDVVDGAPLLVDADAGFVLPQPDAAALADARDTLSRRAAALTAVEGQWHATMRDGTAVPVQANIGAAADALAAARAGAEGSGLVRTEFLFLDRAAPPGTAEQTAVYDAIAAALPGESVTIRLLDIGGDKPSPYLAIAPEENPALGLRGVRLTLAYPEMLRTQLDAILAMAARERVRIMVPMVSDAAEMQRVRAMLTALCAERGVPVPPLGAMVETPAAAVSADLIAEAADFLSIGSNDLTQYVLAMDRGNPAVAAAIDGLHPAVLRLVGETCRHAAARGVPVGVCGALAADPLAAPILIGLGATSLSVPPARVAATRATVAGFSLGEACRHADAALRCAAAAEVRALARRFAEETAR